MEKKYVEYLLLKTKEDYNLLAKDYTRTRVFIPEDIKNLGDYTISGEKVLDSGCGPGCFFEVLEEKEIDYYGIDISERLIEIAKGKYPGFKIKESWREGKDPRTNIYIIAEK